MVDEHFYDLAARPRCLMGKHVPGIGLHQEYERNTVPQLANIREAMLCGGDGSGVTIMEFHLPELGEGVYEGRVGRMALVKPGDTVRTAARTLAEVLTDKATMEVPVSCSPAPSRRSTLTPVSN